MVQILHIHPESPQHRLIQQAADIIQNGGLIALPTDCCYVLACGIGDKTAMDRLRLVRDINEKHLLTLISHDLGNIGQYAKVDNMQYRFLKAATPGAYTFILEATKELPRRIMTPKRKTIGVRIPDHKIVASLLSVIDDPVISSSLILPHEEVPLSDADEIAQRLKGKIDLVIEAGFVSIDLTTVLDLTGAEYHIVRHGKGSIDSLGFSEF